MDTESGLTCEVHGRLRPHLQVYSDHEPELVWVCGGWDGEGCTAVVPESARLRLAAGETYWPGVQLVRD